MDGRAIAPGWPPVRFRDRGATVVADNAQNAPVTDCRAFRTKRERFKRK